jgi:signal transduction histidine kinase
MPINASESLLSVRFIATFRVVIAAFFMVAIWADPAQPVRLADVGYSLIAAFLLWACINLWAALRDWRIEYYLARPALLIDVVAGVGLVYFTEAGPTDFASPLAAILLFTLVEAIFVGGWRTALTAGVIFTCGMIGVIVFMSVLGEAVEFIRIARRVGFFLLITALAVWFGGRQTSPMVPMLVIDPQGQTKSPINEALAFACAFFGATKGFALWTSDEETDFRLESHGPGGELGWRVPPISIDRLDPRVVSPTLFQIGRGHSLRLDEFDRVVRGDASSFDDFSAFGLLPKGRNALAIPIRSGRFYAVLVLSGFRAASRDLLPLARAIAHEIEIGLDRYDLAERTIEDRLIEVRRSVARDLHDNVAQSLAGASFRVEAARKGLAGSIDPEGELQAVHEALQSEQRHVRSMIARLRQGNDIRLRHDLAGDLAELLNVLSGQWRVRLPLTRPAEPIEVGTSQLHEIRQIAREAVANAAQHGQATEVRFMIGAEPKSFCLDIVDNGDGGGQAGSAHPFEPRSIAERVAVLGGRLNARRGPAGVRLYITLPRLSG